MIRKAQSGWRATQRKNSGTWGNRGKGNEIQSAFENGLSFIGNIPSYIDKAIDKVEDGISYGLGTILPRITGKEALARTRHNREAPRDNGYYINYDGRLDRDPIYGMAPLPSSSGKIYTEKLISVIPDYVKKHYTGSYGPNQKAFVDYLRKLGVDVTRFDNADIKTLQLLRSQALAANKIADKTISYTSSGDTGMQTGIYRFLDGLNSGNIQLSEAKNGFSIRNVFKPEEVKTKGMMQHLYDAGIKYSKQMGKEGMNSGEYLASAEMTTHLWPKYQGKLIGNYGTHVYGSGRDVVGDGLERAYHHQPVYRLTGPTKDIPMKESQLFHPDVIKDGKVTTDWNNPDILRIGIPLGIYGLSRNTEKQK